MIYHVSKQILNNAKDYWIKNASEIQNVIGNSYKEKRKTPFAKTPLKNR